MTFEPSSPDRTRRASRSAPVLEPIAPDATPGLSPQDAPPLDPGSEMGAPDPDRRAPRRGWTRLVWAGLGVLASATIITQIVETAAAWASAAPWLGVVYLTVAGAVGLGLAAMAVRELAASARLRRMGEIRRAAEAGEDVSPALRALYADRKDLAWGLARARELAADDPSDAAAPFEREVLGPLDAAAQRSVERAAARVAAMTALAPSALLDAAAASYFNLRMLREIAEIYGGRAGFAAGARIGRRVVAATLAAGAASAADELIEPLIGGGVAGRLSRRAGEGVLNGALTARIGLLAIELTRPLPFRASPPPRLRDLAWGALGVRRGRAAPDA